MRIEAKLKPVFEKTKSVRVAYLFGSQATGKAGPLSDIDIAVLLGGPPDKWFDCRLDLIGMISEALRSDHLDLVLLNEAPPLLRDRVIRYGRVIFCRDEPARIEFEVRTMREYLDFKPYRDLYAKEMLKQIREGRFVRRQ